MSITNNLRATKLAGYSLAFLNDSKRNAVLHDVANNLRAHCAQILEENSKDLALMDQNDPIYDRLLLTEARVHAMADAINILINFATPLDVVLESKDLENGLHLEKIAVPLGVVAVIYESRPNVTVDVFALCFKSGNACVLKGGKEAKYSNAILVDIIHKVLAEHKIDNNIVYLLPPDRASTLALLHATGMIDVCIPRGGRALIDFVRDNAKVPVIETGAGIVHIYFDKTGELTKGAAIINNAKTRRVSVCNAVDCLIIHSSRLPELPELVAPLIQHNVELFADAASHSALVNRYPKPLLHHAQPQDFGQEFLAYKLAIKTVAAVEDAVTHIMQHTSGHSEAIISQDHGSIEYFIKRIDAAVVYVNASTAFTDGGEFGMGAEIGISTQKLHVRGPMGLQALTSYKWLVRGDGNIR
jgi:glutamate-5-semialdehyde dehydrogenase